MVAPLPDIQKELRSQQEKGLELRKSIVEAYRAYLPVLGQSLQSQMVLVCFNLCTERHAKQFLKLSLTQRQTLQQDLQKLGIELIKKISEQSESLLPTDAPSNETPISLLEAIESLEKEISSSLRTTSLAINRLLEHHDILKIKSLDTLFEIAAKAEEAGRAITNPPLLLKAIVDMKEEENEEPVQPLTAIYLHVSDLEFADAKLLGARQALRQLMQKLQSLQKRYSQKVEEETMAEAIAAWRASWYTYESNS